MKTLKTFKTTWPTLAAIAVLCTAGSAFGQQLTKSNLPEGSSSTSNDGATCGPSITQNTNPDTVAAGSVSCNAAGVNTDNAYARNFPIGAATTIKCVDFGIETNNAVAAWPVRVRLYSHPAAGTPVTANLTLLGEQTVMIPASTNLTKFTATFPGAGVAVAASSNLVVELFTACRQTTCAGPPAGDGGSIFIGSNTLGQSAPSYIKAAPCGAADFANLSALGFPNMAVIIELGEGGAVNECTQPLPFCPEDLVGNLQTDPPNGVVGTPDLLKVINSWGQNGQPTGPRPAADMRPLPLGDCLVSTLDLLGVINKWGACPVVVGACCASDGSCTEVTAAACAAALGTYQGDGTLCVNVTCPVLPGNDDCGGAPLLGLGTHVINNTGATDGTAPGGDCVLGGAPNFNLDIWYRHTATCTGNLNVDLCADTSQVTDSVLAVYSGTCPGGLVQIACDDDACTGDTVNGDVSRLTAPVVAGQTYFIRAGTWGANAPGQMALTIGACAVLDNDNCADATALSLPGSSGAENINDATVDVAPVCGGIAMTKAEWYTVVGDGNTITASLCSSPAELWDPRISVYCGASCAALFCVASNQDFCGALPQVSWCSSVGTVYRIAVHTPDDATGEGNYTLTVATSGVPCSPAALCGVPGDECESAHTAVLGNNNGDNSTMSNTVGAPAPCQPITQDEWWSYTATSSGPHTFSLCAGSPGAFDSVIQVNSGACGAGAQIGCDDDSCGGVGVPSVVSANLTNGTTYKVRVGSWNGSPPSMYVLNISLAAGCGACPGGATQEGAPQCRVDGDDPLTDPNGGCNSTPDVFGGPIVLNEVVCGQTSTYVGSTSAQNRDTDWYLFTPAVTGQYQIEACADTSLLVGFVTGVPACTAPAFLAGSTATIPAFAVGTSPLANLTAGTTYAVFAGPPVFTGIPCSNYRIKVIGGGPPPPPPANDGCASAATILHSSVTAGTVVNATPAVGPDAELAGQPFSCHWATPTIGTIHNSVWYKFVATGTTATVTTCASVAPLVDTIVGVFSGTCGGFTQIGCGEDECAAGAAPYYSSGPQIVGLTVGNTYYICVAQPGGWAGEVAGAFNLTVGP